MFSSVFSITAGSLVSFCFILYLLFHKFCLVLITVVISCTLITRISHKMLHVCDLIFFFYWTLKFMFHFFA